MKSKLKFKKLLNEYRSLKYEQEYIKEILRDSHQEFDQYYREFCRKNDIDIPSLERKNSDKVARTLAIYIHLIIKGY